MSVKIHPSAIVEKGAQLGDRVQVEAFAYIASTVSIGDETLIRHHSSVEGNTSLGKHNLVAPYACLGGLTQDLKYKGGVVGLTIGDHNQFREYVTVHGATMDHAETKIGNHNVMLAYSHVAHDCVMGDHNVMSGNSALAGHVFIGNQINIAWSAGIHQFCKIGDYAMVSACSKVVQDILPFMIADGNPACVRAVNKIGLQRNGFSESQINDIKEIFKELYKSGKNRTQALDFLKKKFSDNPNYDQILRFIKNSIRGLA